MILTLENEKTPENLNFELENNMEREDMSTGPGHRGLVSLCVLPLVEVKERRHN